MIENIDEDRELSLADFEYDLPPERIAQYPLVDRTACRLLQMDRVSRQIKHGHFLDIEKLLQAGDCLVLNDTRVIPARIFGRKPTGGKVEILLHKQLGPLEWEVLLKPGKRLKDGGTILIGSVESPLVAEILVKPKENAGMRRIQFKDISPDVLREELKQLGKMPLPPYIDREEKSVDQEMYQTVFARKEGAVASPTAGLHFDQALLQRLREKGVEVLFLTLHVGYGTFHPVAAMDLSEHLMHAEEYEVDRQTAEALEKALDAGRRIVACGTTVVRTLESIAERDETGIVRIQPGRAETKLFIRPPYDFKVVKAMITNFHLPRTTLLMLVAAFAGKEFMDQAYREAVEQEYRFFSYGDAMFVD